jgi:hypothetical protein
MAVDSSSGMEKMRMLIESRRGGGGGGGAGGGAGAGGGGGIPKVFESSTGGGDTGIVGEALADKEMVMQGKRIHAKGKRMELCLTRECESEEGVVGEEEPGSLTRASSNSNDKNKRNESENNDKLFGELGAPDLGVAVAASDSGCDGLIDSPPGWDGDEWIGRPSSNTTWLLKFELLLLYKQKHGMCKFPATLKKATLRKIEHEWDRQLAKEGVEALGSWLAQQKFAKKVGKLSEDRIRLLSGTGALMNRKEEVVAEKKRMAGSWPARFAEVLLVKQHRGNVQVSQRLRDPGHLVKWCSQQRWLVQMGGLPTEREDALRRAGFDWDMQDSYWGDMLMELAWYRLRHGTTNVPFTTPRQPPPTPPGGEGAGRGASAASRGSTADIAKRDSKERALAVWVNNQRELQKRRVLSAHRTRLLLSFGFQFRSHDAEWDEKFLELRRFKEDHGHCDVPQRLEGNQGLGQWLSTQRWMRRKGKLRSDRERRLTSLGLSWWESRRQGRPGGKMRPRVEIG